MKNYFEYSRERNEKIQKNIDSMKPIERIDYFNRLDRIKGFYFPKNIFRSLALVFLTFNLFLVFLCFVLISLETETGKILVIQLLPFSKILVATGLMSIVLGIIEFFFRNFLFDKKREELNRKYDL